MVDENNEYLPCSTSEIEITIDDENNGIKPVSYTHLDVYKRQVSYSKCYQNLFLLLLRNPVIRKEHKQSL